MIDQRTGKQLETVLDFMQHNDPNGDYYGYMDDVQAGKMTIKEIICALRPVLHQWRLDLNNWHDPMQKKIAGMELLIASL